jgi:peptide chain release factor subunit 3
VLELLPHKPILSAGYTAVLHVHSLIVEVIITEMLTQIDKKTGEVAKKRPTFCRSGDVITCRIQAEMPVAVEVCSILYSSSFPSPFLVLLCLCVVE